MILLLLVAVYVIYSLTVSREEMDAHRAMLEAKHREREAIGTRENYQHSMHNIIKGRGL